MWRLVTLAPTYFPERTLDDVMRSATEAIKSHGVSIGPSRGAALELTGVLLEIADPRARLSRTESRGKPFSCLGELCWYLARRKDLEFISYYIPAYSESADDGTIFGGYGPRLFDWRGMNQFANVIGRLRSRPDSRQAVVQLFDAGDILEDHRDVPCTCTLQFMNRNGRLFMLTSMRSNDAFLGLPHDVFCFTMLQEIVAAELGLELGTYKHAVGSLHLYEKDIGDANQFLQEGWQSTVAMPPMPKGDPWPAIQTLLAAESILRGGKELDPTTVRSLDPYCESYRESRRAVNVSRLSGISGGHKGSG